MNKLLILLLLLSNYVFSQSENQYSETVFENKDYFHEFQQEKFFLHTNKTTYFTGETIWWKAYVVSDFSDKPITNTTNLYVNFYDANKKLISQQLFYCENGKAYGEIELPSTLDTGEYYINLATQWNKNFKNKYTVPIYIINSKTSNPLDEDLKVNIADAIDIAFYPESGSLLNNTTNTIYLTLQNNDVFLAEQAVAITDNTTNKAIANIKTNKLGHAKFNLLYQASNNYTATVKYEDSTYTKQLPKTLNSGVLIHKKENLNTKTSQDFTIEFSKEMLAQYNESTIFATVHRNQKLLYILPFKVNKKHKKYVIPIETENLFNGFNIITLFNEKNHPISERPFYVETKQNIEIETIKNDTTKDSITIDFQLKNSYTSTNLSISVLPKDTKLNENSSNIIDAFLLKPYLKTNIHSANHLADVDLDMLLQTQTKQTVKHTFNKQPPIYLQTRGLSIKGRINTEFKKNYKVLLTSTENEIIEVTDINPDKSFVFPNLIMRDSSNYKLAVLDEKGVIVKAGIYVYKQIENYKSDSLLVYNKNQFLTTKEIVKEEMFIDYIDTKDSEILDEVLLMGKKRKEIQMDELYPNTLNELGNGFTQKLQFDEVDEMNNTVIQYLNNQSGVVAVERPMGASIIITRTTFDSFYDSTEALILLNGVPTDAESVAYLPLSEVASIKINASGAGYGTRGSNGVIFIDLKKGGENYKTTPNLNYYTSSTDFGFITSRPTFVASQLIFNSSTTSQFYETLDWIPNFNVLPNKSNTLKIYKGEHENIKLFINGMNNDGQLFCKVVDLPIKKGL